MKNTSDAGGGVGSTNTISASAGGRSRSGSSAAHQRRISVSKRNGTASDSLQSQQNGTSSSSTPPTLTSSLESATSAADVRAALSNLHIREDGLRRNLQSLVASHTDLNRDLMRLDSLRATLGAQVIATRGIATTMLAGAADTAGRLSSTVRNLDLEKEHVEATLRVVEQVAELKACVAGVVGSMGAPQDWEAAAAYLARASRIPESIVKSGFANAVVPTVEVPDPPATTLEDARESLCGLFLREFERAAKESDDARVTRFFKLFPLIGRTDVGLDVYGRYVCQGVAESARNVFRGDAPQAAAGTTHHDSYFFGNALAKLFTHISQIVEGHGALVERHYGGGQMIKVISRLQKEADVQGGIVVDTWSDERGIDRKLTDVKSYPFSFLVQSFGSKGGAGGSSNNNPGGDNSRVNSPALGANGDSARRSEDESGVSMGEIDGLLNEIVIMLSRWSLYSRFLANKCRDDEAEAEAAAKEGAINGKDSRDGKDAAAAATSTEDRPLVIPNVLTQSNLQRKVAARLITPYNLMSTFYFRRSVEKAFQLEEVPNDLSLNIAHAIDNNPPYIISAVDDVMYIVSSVMQKCMQTLQRDVVVGAIPPIGRVLSSDFIGMIQRKMIHEAYPRSTGQNQLPPEDRVIAFIVLINSLDMAMEYLARIVSTRMGVPVDEESSSSAPSGGRESQRAQRIPSPTAPAVVAHLRESFSPFDHDVTLVAAALANLFSGFTTKAVELQNEGLQVLFTNYIKPRLHAIVSDTFRDADYTLDEQELAEVAEMNDEDLDIVLESVSRRFEHGWDGLMRPLARIMTPRTFAHAADLAARYLAKSLERRVWSMGSSGGGGDRGGDRGDRERGERRRNPICAYGAIRLERDVNGIVGAVARGSSNYGARELFAKTTQILMVANMEDDEWEELGGVAANGEGGEGIDDEDEDGMVWLLSEDERRRARGMVLRVV
ncbi:Golgi transport complex subunit 4 [Sporothrix stenoceras]|uniref:Conserved oligomeric Golgi complex subunit 4 n=1 Tax=Sporothrix stenoceras TaxID=5173 RepID=A0ABR3Z0C6_9PEZI